MLYNWFSSQSYWVSHDIFWVSRCFVNVMSHAVSSIWLLLFSNPKLPRFFKELFSESWQGYTPKRHESLWRFIKAAVKFTNCSFWFSQVWVKFLLRHIEGPLKWTCFYSSVLTGSFWVRKMPSGRVRSLFSLKVYPQQKTFFVSVGVCVCQNTTNFKNLHQSAFADPFKNNF